jgi:dipeptidase D
MTQITDLNPALLWSYFAKICSIPHPSRHEAALRNFLNAEAKQAGLHCTTDTYGNLRIDRPAAPGFEQHRRILLQAHLDMVPQKNKNKQFDFATQPVTPKICGAHVAADGTTLGADNGIGLAAAMAVLLDKTLQYGPIAGIFTVEEEISLRGAAQLSEKMLDGDMLINLDSEDENTVFIGGAGGVQCQHHLKPEYASTTGGFISCSIDISGLRGGHSGCNIHEGRGNAIQLMAELLSRLNRQCGISLANFNGGNLTNVIPREASATVAFAACKQSDIDGAIADFLTKKRSFFGSIEPNFGIKTASSPVSKTFTREFTTSLLELLNACPHGVIAMSPDFPGTVATSTNLAAISTTADAVKIKTSQRSLSDVLRDTLTADITQLFARYNAQTIVSNQYPGWTPQPNSTALRKFCQVHRDVTGTEPKITAIHAGLECGFIKNINPRLDVISFGPEIGNAHSPNEYVDIASVERFWTILTALLPRMAEVS